MDQDVIDQRVLVSLLTFDGSFAMMYGLLLRRYTVRLSVLWVYLYYLLLYIEASESEDG